MARDLFSEFGIAVPDTPAPAPVTGAAAAAGGRDLFADLGIDPGAGRPGQTGFDRLWQGIQDVPNAGAQLLTHLLPDSVVSGVNSAVQTVNDMPGVGPVTRALGMTPATMQQIDTRIARDEARYQADRAASGGSGMDGWRAVGNAVAALPLAVATPAATTLGGAAALGAGTGAISGALQPVAAPNDQGEFWRTKAGQVGTGAVLGGATGPVITAASRLVSPNVSPEVQYLLDRGVTPTPGQMIGGAAARTEEKLASVPLLGDVIKGAQRRGIEDFNRATFNEVLDPIGQSMPGREIGRDAVAAVGDRVSAAYDALLPRLRFQADGQFVQELGGLAGLVQGLPEKEARQFSAFVGDKLSRALGNNGRMDGLSFKELESSLSKEISTFGRSQDAYQQKLADAYRTLQLSLRDGLERSNPGAADQLGRINRSWAMATRLEGAAGSQGARDGVFTPAQLAAAVKAGDNSVRKRAYARGDALMQPLSDAGKSVLSLQYPDSGTAGRAILGGLLGGGAMISPTAAATVAALALPYTRTGQRVIAQALTQRDAAVRRLSPMAQAGIIGLLGQ